MNETLTIIIPAYNESARISKCLYDIDTYITEKNKANLFKVIVVNDGSTDNTQDTVNNWVQKDARNKNCFCVINYKPNKGKGNAVKTGILNTTSDLVLYTDADGASPAKEFEKLLHSINSGADVAIGSRVLKDEKSNVKMTLKRRFIGLVFHLILKSLNLADVKDTQCGFKLFKTEALKKIAKEQKCLNYSFDIEYLFLAKKFGCKITEVPINWYHVEGSKISILRDSIKMLLEVLKIRFIYKYNK